MLFHRFFYIPDTGQSFLKRNKITFSEFNRPLLCFDNHPPLKEIALFRAFIVPVKAGHLFLPDWPRGNMSFIKFGLIRFFYLYIHSLLLFLKPSPGGIQVSDLMYPLTVFSDIPVQGANTRFNNLAGGQHCTAFKVIPG